MVATEQPSARLARFVADSQWRDIPERVRQESKRALLNFLGAAVGGSTDVAVERAIAALRRCGGPGQASVLGRSERFDMLNAAFLNAASGNVLDYDDTHHPTVIHPTSPVAPVLLALAEQQRMTGAELLHALVLGIEIACRLGNAVSVQHYVRGWHITSTCGVVGAAAAAAKVLNLDPETTLCALGLAANQGCGLVESLGSMAKSLSVGNAARNGLLAALLAREGFSAARETLEGPRGFVQVMSDAPRPNALTEALGVRWEVMHNALKPYPSGVVLHPVIDACLEIIRRHRPRAEKIAHVTVVGNPLLRQRADRPAPHSGREAAVSAQHTVSVCFLYGDADVQRYTDACVHDANVQAVGSRVRVAEDGALAVESARVVVQMDDGASYEAYIPHALGSLTRPMSDARLETKVRTLTRARAISIDRLIDTAWKFDELDDAARIIAYALPVVSRSS